MPVDRSSHATGTLIVGANGKLAAPRRAQKATWPTRRPRRRQKRRKGVRPIAFKAEAGHIHANGQKFAIKGANWFGSEDRNGPPQGLDEHGIPWYLAFLRSHGFNAVRLLFNHESVLSNARMYSRKVPKQFHKFEHAPELEGLTYVEMLAEIASQAAEYGLLVLIACHRTTPSAWPGQGKWYMGRSPRRACCRAGPSWRARCAGTGTSSRPTSRMSRGRRAGAGARQRLERRGVAIGNHVPASTALAHPCRGCRRAPPASSRTLATGGATSSVHTAPVKLKDQSRLVLAAYVRPVRPAGLLQGEQLPVEHGADLERLSAFVRQATGT